MIRYVVLTLLLIVGVILAFNIGQSRMFLASAAINSFTMEVNDLLRRNGLRQYMLLTDMALFMNLLPWAFGTGIFASLVFGPRRATSGAVLWIAFSLAATVRFCIGAAETQSSSLNWLPVAIGDWCTVPIYFIGIAIDRCVRRKTWPGISAIDWLVIPALIATFFSVPMLPHLSSRLAGYFVTSVCLALRLFWPPVTELANKPMQPNGAIGRIEVESLSSPTDR